MSERFIHQKDCPAYGFRSLKNAQYLKRTGQCKCDVPGVDAINRYRCKHCGKTVLRESTKAWIKSVCGQTGKTVHLMKVKS